MYIVIRIAVASAILISFHFTRGFGSTLHVFVMAFAASLSSQGVAFAVKMIAGKTERSRRSLLLLTGCVVLVAASVMFVVLDKQFAAPNAPSPVVRGLLDISTLKRSGETYELVIIDGDRRIPIHYRGVLSDQVRDRAEILARGHWKGEVFVATELRAKCPTTYDTPSKPQPAAEYR